jgi:hypothetical protein
MRDPTESMEADLSPPSGGIVVRNCSLLLSLYIRGGGGRGGGGGWEDVALLQPLSTSSQGSVPLMGQCHKMDIFFEGLNILDHCFLCMRQWFSAFQYPIQL